jgi:hypothetical protein
MIFAFFSIGWNECPISGKSVALFRIGIIIKSKKLKIAN